MQHFSVHKLALLKDTPSHLCVNWGGYYSYNYTIIYFSMSGAKLKMDGYGYKASLYVAAEEDSIKGEEGLLVPA